jgi:hypothetical protein
MKIPLTVSVKVSRRSYWVALHAIYSVTLIADESEDKTKALIARSLSFPSIPPLTEPPDRNMTIPPYDPHWAELLTNDNGRKRTMKEAPFGASLVVYRVFSGGGGRNRTAVRKPYTGGTTCLVRPIDLASCPPADGLTIGELP